MKKLLVLVFLFAAAGVLFAGYSAISPVEVQYYSTANGMGYGKGSMSSAKNTPNNVEYIGCFTEAFHRNSASYRVYCGALDASGRYVKAWSFNQLYIDIVKTMTAHSYIYFEFNGNAEITRLKIENFSSNIP
ncbi:MAG: hypothetical protein GY754_24315 [bacterium]|nr:hypothetical protein [bacterium]